MLTDAATIKLNSFPAFIALDGVNGAGKSTLLAKIVAYFNDAKLPIKATREPGGTKLGETIRSIVLGQKDDRLSETAELLLFSADRAEHVEKVIRPALAGGSSIITDRYYYSTTAFQGFGRGLNRKTIDTVNNIAIDGTVPDLAIFLDLPPEIGLRRNDAESGRDRDSFESETLNFHQRLRDGFLALARQIREPAIVLDAQQPPEVVFQTVKAIFDRSR
jgi:dTMP kinase